MLNLLKGVMGEEREASKLEVPSCMIRVGPSFWRTAYEVLSAIPSYPS